MSFPTMTRAALAAVNSTDVGTVLETAEQMHLKNDPDSVTPAQHAELQRLFPRRPGEPAHWWKLRISNLLETVATDLRDHFEWEGGYLNADGERPLQSVADESFDAAEMLARLLIATHAQPAAVAS